MMTFPLLICTGGILQGDCYYHVIRSLSWERLGFAGQVLGLGHFCPEPDSSNGQSAGELPIGRPEMLPLCVTW